MTLKVVQLNEEGREVKAAEIAESSPSDALLDLVEKKGMKISYGCRSGSCGVCRVRIDQGAELLQERNFVEEDTWLRCEDAPNIRLACQARVKNGTVGSIVISPAPEVILKD